jgi:integrase
MTGSIRRGRKAGTWELRIYQGRDPITGKPRQKSMVFTGGKRDAGRELNRFAEANQERPATAATLNTLMARHIEGLAAAGRADATIVNYRRTAANIANGVGLTELRKLTPADLEDYYAQAVRWRAPSTVALDHRHISAALQHAVRLEWVGRNVARLAQSPSAQGRPVEPPTLDQVKALMAEAARRDMDKAMLVFLALMTGARRGELCRLQWRDVGWSDRSLLLRKTKGDAKPHRVSVDVATVEALALYRLSIAEKLGRTPEDVRYVFSPDLGSSPMVPGNVSTWWGWVRKAAGVGPVRLHDLRHFSVTYLLDAGVPLKTVSARHGHARTSMTVDVYGHAIKARDQEAADAMGHLGIEAPHR